MSQRWASSVLIQIGRSKLTPLYDRLKELIMKIMTVGSSIYKYIYGQESPGWISLFKLVTFCCCWKYTETLIFLVKLICQWILDRDGRGIIKDIKKKVFFSKRDKKWLGQFTRMEPFSTFQLFKLSKLCYHFCRVLKRKIIFFISLAIPRPSPSRIHWSINFTNKN